MSKHLLEEVIEFNKRKINRFTLVFFLIIVVINSSPAQQFKEFLQVYLNGFGLYIPIDEKISLNNLFVYDIDQDGNLDIGGLDESGKILLIYYGKGINQFNPPIKIYFPKKISGLIVKKLNINKYVNLILWSKLENQIRIYSFINRYPRFNYAINTECCISEVTPVNLDLYPESELILSGANFRGIAIINLRRSSYQIQYIDDGFYTNVVPFKLNSDELIDLVAYNIREKSLVKFRNNGFLHFSKNVHTTFVDEINQLLKGDFNDDGISDLIIIPKLSKQFFIAYGNGLGSFSYIENFYNNYEMNNAITYDFNRDLIEDLIFYNRKSRAIAVRGISKNADYSEKSIPILRTENLYSFVPYTTVTSKGILFSTEKGIFLIVRLSIPTETLTFALAVEPIALESFYLENEIFPHVLIIDSFDKTLRLISRNEFNYPKDLFWIKLSSDYDRIKILNLNKESLDLVCYKIGLFHFDFVRIDFSSNRYKKINLSINYPIMSIGLNSLDDQKFDIGILGNSKDGLVITVLNPFSMNKLVLQENILKESNLAFSFDFSTRSLYYLKRIMNSTKILLVKNEYDLSFKNYQSKIIYSFQDQGYLDFNLFQRNVSNENLWIFIYLRQLNRNKLVSINSKYPNKINYFDAIQFPSNIYYDIWDQNSKYLFVYYNLHSKSIEQLQEIQRGNLVQRELMKYPNYILYTYSILRDRVKEIIYIENYSKLNLFRIEK